MDYDFSKIDWEIKQTQFIFEIATKTRDLIKTFGFAGKEGMEQIKHDLYILVKAATEELKKRGIRYE